MKSIALGRMLKDGRHVVGCRYSLDDALLGARLRRLGLEAKLYSGKGEGRVVDLARQFVRMRADAFVFAVEPDTVSLVLQIVRQMRALLPAARIFFRGSLDERQRQALDLDAAVSWLPAAIDDCVAAVSALIGHDGGEAPIDEACSPYLSGLIHEEDLGRIGLSADQPLPIFAKELAWLSRKAPADLRIPVRADTRSVEELAAIGEMIRESGVQATLVIAPSRHDGPAPSPTPASAFGVNGVIALHTGIYGDPISGIRHLEVSAMTAPEQRRAAYAWAGPNMASRSALVFHPQGESRGLESFAAPLTLETNGWPMHSYVIEPSTPTDSSVAFDGEPIARQAIRTLPLSAFDADPGDSAAITFLSLTRTADVDAFERRLQTFTETGRIHIGDPARQVYFENSCRWTRRGTCQLAALKRVQLRDGGRLGACRDAGEVGSLAQSHDEIVIQLKRDQQTQGIRRECAVCAVRDECSQCTQLPGDWAGRYCSIRKQHPAAPLFIEIFSMAHGLAPLLGAGAGSDLELLVSYSGLPNQHFCASAAEHREGQRPVILSANGKHIAWWRGTRRLCRLSGPLALMAEAWWSSGSQEEIVGDLSAKFSVSTDVAIASLETGVHKLRTEGIIHA